MGYTGLTRCFKDMKYPYDTIAYVTFVLAIAVFSVWLFIFNFKDCKRTIPAASDWYCFMHAS